MAQYLFGAGILTGIPLMDANGNAIANPTPVPFGELQDCAIDISFETKTLHGNKQFPVAVGRGKGKVSGKASFAKINGMLFNSLFFGQTLSSGIISDVFETTGAAIPASPYQITVTPPSSGTFAFDLGVRDSNGVIMTRVASAPAAGQYSVNASGQYTFAAADTGKVVYINYQYTATSTTAKKMTITNLPMGYAPSFKAELYMPYQGKSLILTLNSCISGKLGLATKQDDFVVPGMDFEAFADANDIIGTLAMSE